MYLPRKKIPLAENRFLQAGKGAENKRKNPGSALRWYEACFPRVLENCIYLMLTACPFVVLTKLDRREFIIRF